MAARKGDHIYDTCVLYLTTWKKIEKLNFAASAAASNWNFVQQNQHLPQLTLQGDHSLQSVTAHSGLTKPRPPLISGGQTASDPAHIRFSMVLTWGHFLRPILKQQLWHPLRTSRPRGREAGLIYLPVEEPPRPRLKTLAASGWTWRPSRPFWRWAHVVWEKVLGCGRVEAQIWN